ncbi:MAG: alkaline phosphatase D family protein [Planctomycetes bacterium]|nr:alkaline phosphatase D family protein [Planctomycetota bacterium]
MRIGYENFLRWGVFCLVASALLHFSNRPATAQTDWPDPIAHDVMPYHTSGLTHGPMLGRPTATSMRVWVRTSKPIPFRVVYDTKLPLTLNSPSMKGSTLSDADNTGFVELTQLKPNTRYYYGVVTHTGLIDTRMEFDRPWPSFRTLPDETSYPDSLNNKQGLFNFSFSIGCGMRQKSPKDPEQFGIYGNPPSFLSLYKHHADDIAFHIVNGDFTYEEVLDGTRAGYADNYKLYLRRGRNVANLFRYVPLMVMYDDHEVNSNLDGSGEIGLGDGNYLKRDDALSVWNQYAQWANDETPQRGTIRFGSARVQKGSNILFDPNADFRTLKPEQVSTIHVGHYIQGDGRSKKVRGGANIGVYGLTEVIDRNRLRVRPAFKANGSAPYSIGTHHYFDRKVGNCHFFFLDMRGERSRFYGEKRSHDPDRFILGETQRKWFLDGMKNSDADFLFVISPDPWVIYHSGYHVRPELGTGSKGDGFCGYVHERELLIPELDKIQKPVLIFTGDVHNSCAVQITDNVWEFMCGPMNSAGHPIGTAGLPPFGGFFDSEGRKVKIKWTGGFPDNVHYSRNRGTFYTVVNVNNIMKAARPRGVGHQYVSYDEPQVIVQFYDGYTGKLAYAEGISTADAKDDQSISPKKSRWPVKKK